MKTVKNNQPKKTKSDSLKNKNLIKSSAKALSLGLATVMGISGAANAGAVIQDNIGITHTAYAGGTDVVTFDNTIATTTLGADATFASGVTTTNKDLVWGITGGFKLTVTGKIATTASGDTNVNLTGTGTELALAAVWTENSTNASDQHHISLGAGTTLSMTTNVTRVMDVNGASAGVGTLSIAGNSVFAEAVGTIKLATISVVASKTATFNEAVAATTMTLTGNASALKALTATNVNLTGTTLSMLNTDNAAVAGTIAEVSGTTSLVVKNSADTQAASVTTFAGTVTVDTVVVGSATTGGSAKFSEVVTSNITSFGGNHSNEQGDLEFVKGVTGNITMTDAAGATKTTLSGSNARTVTGNIASGTANKGTLDITSTAATITGTVGAEALRLLEVQIADGADTVLQSKIFAATLDIDTNAIGETTTITSGNFIGTNGGTAGALQIAGGEIVLDTTVIAGSTVFDVKETTGSTAGVLIGAAVNVVSPVNFTSGTITLIDGVFASTSNDEAAFITGQNTILTDYSIATTSNIDTVITATTRTASAIGTDLSVTANEGAALKQLVDASAGDATMLADLQAALVKHSAGTGQAAETKVILEQTAVQTDATAGSVSASRAMTGTVQSIVSNRLASLRSGDAFVSGISAGNGMSANSGFIQAFGSEVTQKNTTKGKADVYGYESDTSGVAIGFDGVTQTGETIGLSASASTTDVKGKGTGKATNSIDSYTVSLYADKATDFGYVEGSLTYGVNTNAGQRFVKVNTIDRAYKSKYDSDQISLKIGAGKPTEVSDGAYVTPFGSISASVISTDVYTETSVTANDVLRLKIAQEDVTSVVGSVGVKGHYVSNYGTPMISLAINNEFGDTQINSSNTYQGGGTAFKTSTDVEELSATLGLGYSFGSDAASVEVGYEAETNDNEYTSHYGSVKIVAKF